MAKLNTVLAHFAEKRGISQVPGSESLFVEHNGVPASIFYRHQGYYGSSSGYIVAVPLEEGQWDKEKGKKLKEYLKKSGLVLFNKQKNNLEVLVQGIKTATVHERLDRTLTVLEEQFPLMGIKTKQGCFFCGKESPEDMVEEGMVYYPAHTQCKKEQAYKLAQEIETNIRTGNYPLAIVCALIGGIAGSIPSIILLVAAGYLFDLLFALIPIAAFQGYKIGKGILSRGTPLIIGVISLVCTVFFVLVTIYIQLFRDYGYFKPGEFIETISHPENLSAVIPQFLQALFFTALGFVIAWGTINKTNKAKLERVKNLHGNLEDGNEM